MSEMRIRELVQVADAIEVLSIKTDVDISDIVEILIGFCLSEEDAGEIKRYHSDESYL